MKDGEKKQTIVSILDDPLKQRIIERALNIEGLQKLYIYMSIYVCLPSRPFGLDDFKDHSLHSIFFRILPYFPGKVFWNINARQSLGFDDIPQYPSITTVYDVTCPANIHSMGTGRYTIENYRCFLDRSFICQCTP